MADFWLKTGDLVPAITATLEDSNGDPIDIESADITFSMRMLKATSALIDNVTAENLQVDDGSDGSMGKVRYKWQDGDTDFAGGYRGEWKVQFADGPGTMPNNRYTLIAIRPSLGTP